MSIEDITEEQAKMILDFLAKKLNGTAIDVRDSKETMLLSNDVGVRYKSSDVVFSYMGHKMNGRIGSNYGSTLTDFVHVQSKPTNKDILNAILESSNVADVYTWNSRGNSLTVVISKDTCLESLLVECDLNGGV